MIEVPLSNTGELDKPYWFDHGDVPTCRNVAESQWGKYRLGPGMPAIGTKRTSLVTTAVPAFGGKADIL